MRIIRVLLGIVIASIGHGFFRLAPFHARAKGSNVRNSRRIPIECDKSGKLLEVRQLQRTVRMPATTRLS